MADLWQESERCESFRKQGKMHFPFRSSGQGTYSELFFEDMPPILTSLCFKNLQLFCFLPSFFSFLLSFQSLIEIVFKLKRETVAYDDARIECYVHLFLIKDLSYKILPYMELDQLTSQFLFTLSSPEFCSWPTDLLSPSFPLWPNLGAVSHSDP